MLLSELVKVSASAKTYTAKIFSNRSFSKGDSIYRLGNEPRQTPQNVYTIQMNENEHYDLRSEVMYINHSCDPSVIFDTRSRTLYASKSIRQGDELTFFYPSSEYEMIRPFKCQYGSPRCIRYVSGAKFLDIYKLQSEGQFFNTHVHLLKNSNKFGFV